MPPGESARNDTDGNDVDRLGVVSLVAAGVVLVLVVAAALDRNRLDDDAYMFVRYARNVLAHGAVAWNPGEPPVYGLTSLAMLALVTFFEMTLRADAAFVLVTSTLVCGALFLLAVAWFVCRSAHADTRAQRIAALVATGVGLAWAGRVFAAHCVSGMDTMLSLCGLMVLLVLAKRWQARPDVRRSLLWGSAGGALLWLRPDLLAFAVIVPACAALLATSARHARGAVVALVCSLGVAAVLASLAWAYFGTPIPLPAWAKVLRGYGADMQALYARAPAEQLAAFVRSHAAFLLVALAGGAVWLRRAGARAASVEIGVGVATLTFVVFQRFFVLMIMGDRQRFYYPALAALVVLAVQGGLVLARTPAATRLWQRRTWRRAGWVLALVALAVPALQAVTVLRQGPRFAHFTVLENFEHGFPGRMWLGLDGFSRLPDDLVIATTEVGYPGVLNPGKTIVDLSGLHDAVFALEGFSGEALFARYQPDLVMIPTRHYADIRGALLGHPEFRNGYDFVRPEGSLGIGLRRASPHYAAMLEVLRLSRARATASPGRR